MAVAFDAVGTGGTANTTAGLTYPIPIGASASALLVAVGGYYGFGSYTTLTTHTVTVGSIPLTLLGIVDTNNSAGFGWVELWGIINPPTGVQNITVIEVDNPFNAAATIYSNATTYTGVAQFGTPVINTGSTLSLASGSIVSTTGNMVVSAQGVWGRTLTVGGSGTSRYNQPTTGVGTVTLLLQDIAGASTVTLTSTAGSAGSWGVVSVNLIGGTQWHVNSSALAMTTTRAAGASFVGRAYTVGASLALTTATTANGTGQHLGPALRYVGRAPDSNSVLATSSYTQAQNNATLVTPAWISQQITIATANLVTEDWVDQQVANHSTQTQVTTALSAYTPNSALGAHNGIAQLNGSQAIPVGQLPTLVTNSLAVNYDAATSGTIWLPTGQSVTTASNNVGAVPLAQVTIPNPGYPWVPWPFAVVQGQAGGTPPGTRLAGSGNFGLLAVTPVGDNTVIYAAGVCTDDMLANYYLCQPGGATGVGSGLTPQTQTPIVGGATLLLSGCSWSGTGYVFWGTGLYFYVLCLPAIGG